MFSFYSYLNLSYYLPIFTKTFAFGSSLISSGIIIAWPSRFCRSEFSGSYLNLSSCLSKAMPVFILGRDGSTGTAGVSLLMWKSSSSLIDCSTGLPTYFENSIAPPVPYFFLTASKFGSNTSMSSYISCLNSSKSSPLPACFWKSTPGTCPSICLGSKMRTSPSLSLSSSKSSS